MLSPDLDTVDYSLIYSHNFRLGEAAHVLKHKHLRIVQQQRMIPNLDLEKKTCGP